MGQGYICKRWQLQDGNGASYTLTVKKEGYTDYSETFTYTGNSEEPVFLKTVTLSPIMMQNIRFSVKDKASGAEISGASIKVKKGYYTTVSPESDGSYKLQKRCKLQLDG